MQKEKPVTTEVKISNFIDKAWKPAAVVLALSLGLYGGYVAYGIYASAQEKKAQEALFALQKKVQDKADAVNKVTDENKPEAAKAAKKIDKTPEALSENYGYIIKEMQAFIESQKGKKASYIAAVQTAELATDYKNFELAVDILSSVKSVLSDRDIFSGLIRTQLGSALMELKKYDEAKAQFAKVIDAKSLKAFQPQALLLMGVCHLQTGDTENANSTFSRLEQDFPLTSAANSAKDFKKLASLKGRN